MLSIIGVIVTVFFSLFNFSEWVSDIENRLKLVTWLLYFIFGLIGIVSTYKPIRADILEKREKKRLREEKVNNAIFALNDKIEYNDAKIREENAPLAITIEVIFHKLKNLETRIAALENKSNQ